MFNSGWLHLGEILTDAVAKVVGAGRRSLTMITYEVLAKPIKPSGMTFS